MNKKLEPKAKLANQALGKLIEEISSLNEDSEVSEKVVDELRAVLSKCRVTNRLVIFKLYNLKKLGHIDESIVDTVKRLLHISKSELYKEIQRADIEKNCHDNSEEFIGFYSNSSFLDAIRKLSRHCDGETLKEIFWGCQEGLESPESVSFQDLCLFLGTNFPELHGHLSVNNPKRMKLHIEREAGIKTKAIKNKEDAKELERYRTEPYEEEALYKFDPSVDSSLYQPAPKEPKFIEVSRFFKHENISTSWLEHMFRQNDANPNLTIEVIKDELSKLDDIALKHIENLLKQAVEMVTQYAEEIEEDEDMEADD